jgi:hypothetical protein
MCWSREKDLALNRGPPLEGPVSVSCYWIPTFNPAKSEPGGFDYEMDLELFEPYYNGDEGCWTSENIDWLVYASHERSLTVAGLKNVTYIEDASVTALSSV